MKLDDYGVYTIQSELAKASGRYVHIPYATLKSGQKISLWVYEERGVDFTDHFEFVFVPVPGAAETYYLANLRSGLTLMVDGDSVIQGCPEGTPEDDEISERKAQFTLEEVEDGVFRFSNEMTGKYLAVNPSGKTFWLAAVPAMDEETEKVTDDTAMRFRLSRVKRLARPLPEPVTKAGPRVPPLKNIHTDLPLETEPTLREIERLPYFVVNDPIYPRPRQVAVSPYYTLGRLTTWRKVFDRQLDGIVERETEEVTETGLTTLDAKTVASTFSWATSATAEASYKGFGFKGSLKVTAKLAGEASRSAQSSAEHRQSHLFTETILYPAIGKPYRLAKWRPADRYELRRSDGSLVASWDAVRAEEEIIDVFPRSVKAPERRMDTSEDARKTRATARKEAAKTG